MERVRATTMKLRALVVEQYTASDLSHRSFPLHSVDIIMERHPPNQNHTALRGVRVNNYTTVLSLIEYEIE